MVGTPPERERRAYQVLRRCYSAKPGSRAKSHPGGRILFAASGTSTRTRHAHDFNTGRRKSVEGRPRRLRDLRDTNARKSASWQPVARAFSVTFVPALVRGPRAAFFGRGYAALGPW